MGVKNSDSRKAAPEGHFITELDQVSNGVDSIHLDVSDSYVLDLNENTSFTEDSSDESSGRRNRQKLNRT